MSLLLCALSEANGCLISWWSQHRPLQGPGCAGVVGALLHAGIVELPEAQVALSVASLALSRGGRGGQALE